MRKYDIGGITLPPLPAAIPPQFSITNKVGPSKLPSMDFSSSTKAKGGFFKGMGGMGSLGNMASTVSSLIPQTEQSGLTTGLNAGYDAAANAVSAIPGVGTIIGGAMKIGGMLSDGLTALGVGTDQMTTTDKILDSKFMKLTPIGLINSFGAKKADTIVKDNDAFEQVGSSYGGTTDVVDNALEKSGKKYGLLSGKGRNKANREIARAKLQQTKMGNIADEARDAFSNQSASLSMINNRNLLGMTGGYQQRGSYIGRNGLKLPSAEEMQRAVETVTRIRQQKKEAPKTIEEFKEGGKMNVIPEGALHAHKHHMDVDGITPKGIAVVTQEEGGVVQHAEIERNEIIFTKEVTEELERLYKDGSDEAAIQAGKLIAKQIIENTQDNTGLISEVQV